MEVENSITYKHDKGKYGEGVEGLNHGFRRIRFCTVAKVKQRNRYLGKSFEQHFGPTHQHVDGMMHLVIAVVATAVEMHSMKVENNAKDCHGQCKGKDYHKSDINTLLRIVSDVSVFIVVSSEKVHKLVSYFVGHQDHVLSITHEVVHTVLVFSFSMNASKYYAVT